MFSKPLSCISSGVVRSTNSSFKRKAKLAISIAMQFLASNSRSTSSARFAHSRKKQVSRSTKCLAEDVPIMQNTTKTRQIDIALKRTC